MLSNDAHTNLRAIAIRRMCDYNEAFHGVATDVAFRLKDLQLLHGYNKEILS